MSVVDDLKNVDRSISVSVSLFFIGLIAPGFLTLYLFKPDLLKELETTKVVIFSIALTAPSFVLHFFCSSIAGNLIALKKPEALSRLGKSWDFYRVYAMTNYFNFSAALIVAYLASLSFTGFFWLMFLLVSLSAVGEIWRLANLAKGTLGMPLMFPEDAVSVAKTEEVPEADPRSDKTA